MTDIENEPKRDQAYRLLVQALEKNWMRMAKAVRSLCSPSVGFIEVHDQPLFADI